MTVLKYIGFKITETCVSHETMQNNNACILTNAVEMNRISTMRSILLEGEFVHEQGKEYMDE